MKRTKQCPKCQSLRIAYLDRALVAKDPIVADHPKLHPEGSYIPANASPVPVTIAVGTEVIETGWAAWGALKPLVGQLEVYMCADCGLVEHYLAHVAAVDWKSFAGLMWINENPDGQGPFR